MIHREHCPSVISPRLRGEVDIERQRRCRVRGRFRESEHFESPPHPDRCAIQPAPQAGNGSACLRQFLVFYVDLAVSGLVYGCMYADDGRGPDPGLRPAAHPAHRPCRRLRARRLHRGRGRQRHRQPGARLPGRDRGERVAGIAIYRFAYQPIAAHPPAFVPMIVSIGLLHRDAGGLPDGVRRAYGIAFDNNPWYVAHVGSSPASTVTTSRSPWWWRRSCLLVGFGPVRGPHARRHRLAGDGERPADGHQLRRRPDTRALPQLHVRLGLWPASPAAWSAC